jgi:hypothetical protein
VLLACGGRHDELQSHSQCRATGGNLAAGLPAWLRLDRYPFPFTSRPLATRLVCWFAKTSLGPQLKAANLFGTSGPNWQNGNWYDVASQKTINVQARWYVLIDRKRTKHCHCLFDPSYNIDYSRTPLSFNLPNDAGAAARKDRARTHYYRTRVLMIMLLTTISNSPLIDDVMVNGTAWPEAATAVMKNAGPRGGTSAVPPLLL